MATPPATPGMEAKRASAPFIRSNAEKTLNRTLERGVEILLFASAALAILVMAAIFYVLFTNSLTFFRSEEVSIMGFLTGTEWSPDIPPRTFGVLPLVNGTLMVTLGAALFAVPLGLGSAIYLSEFAHPRIRSVLKPTIELLAGIPSIVFGLFAVMVISPILRENFDAAVFNAANAIVVLAFMVLPIITSLAEDALRSVPQELRAGALALGATKWEVTKQVVVPAGLSGIVAAVLLGFSRAVGETMAVTLAAGARPQWGLNFFESIQTMTAFIAQRSQGDIVQTGPSFYSLFGVGLLLFLITFGINIVAARILTRYREVY